MSLEARRGFCLLVLAFATSSFAQTTAPNSEGQDAIAAILHALDQYQVVALGEIHGGEKEHTLFRALLSDARFPPKVNDIVVEFGNAFYQLLVDHYVSGEDVPLADLRQVWRTTTQLMAWDSPVYEQFYLAVRLMNQKLPASRRVRVLLGDPPVDWTKVRKRADIDWNRDAFLYSVIDRILTKGRKGLIIAGAGRLGRNTGIQLRPGSTATSRPEVVFGGKTAMNSLDDRYPGKIFVALPYTGFGDLTPALEPRISAWPIPSIVLTNRISQRSRRVVKSAQNRPKTRKITTQET